MNLAQRELLTTGASALGVPLDAIAVERFSMYLALLQLWGKKINLTSRLETSDVIIYHFLDALAGAPILAASTLARAEGSQDFAGLSTGTLSESASLSAFLERAVDKSSRSATIFQSSRSARVVDLGAGAGLPSLPLKFALPGLQVLLVESVRKKVAFCQEAIRVAGTTGIRAVWGRGEDLGARPEHHQAYDWAVSRALGPAADVAKLALPFLAPGGRVLLYKGVPDSGELQALDDFCAKRQASWEQCQVAVPHLEGARSLITVNFP